MTHFLSLKASLKGGYETALQDNSRKEEAVHSSSLSKNCEQNIAAALNDDFDNKVENENKVSV